MAATLVVGTFAVTTTTIATTQTAFAFSKNKKGDENSKNGNTITALKCENKGSASGFDTTTNQECENLICTHPGENATCVQEGLAVAAVQQGNQTTTPVKLTCEECFTKFLSSTQISLVIQAAGGRVTTLGQLCAILPTAASEAGLIDLLESPKIGVSHPVAEQLIQCLKDAGIVFPF
jgi:hypothetical protein